MSATAFQRRRRELEAKKAQEADDYNKDNEQVENVDNQTDDEQATTIDDVESMTKSELQDALKERGINKPANTGVKKLKEALKDAIK